MYGVVDHSSIPEVGEWEPKHSSLLYRLLYQLGIRLLLILESIVANSIVAGSAEREGY